MGESVGASFSPASTSVPLDVGVRSVQHELKLATCLSIFSSLILGRTQVALKMNATQACPYFHRVLSRSREKRQGSGPPSPASQDRPQGSPGASRLWEEGQGGESSLRLGLGKMLCLRWCRAQRALNFGVSGGVEPCCLGIYVTGIHVT